MTDLDFLLRVKVNDRLIRLQPSAKWAQIEAGPVRSRNNHIKTDHQTVSELKRTIG
jgi:hypothetical protein